MGNALTPDPDQLFPFPLDAFQRRAIEALAAGRSVVVCAPTGSGKTLVAEYAIHRALWRGERVFYTTPLKALSNQKFRDFRQQFGAEMVGLLTGDVSINRDAPVVVMTTEIFRNMLYGTPIGEVGTSLVGLNAVVLDECHYMNDPQRGTVWEETIIYCPPSVQLVALSATVANSQELTQWIQQVHGPTELIYSDFRPVPLQFFFGNQKGIFPLLNETKTGPNPHLKLRRPTGDRQGIPEVEMVVKTLRDWDLLPAIYFIFSRRGCDQAVQAVRELDLLTPEESERLRQQVDEFLARNPELYQPGSMLEALYRGIAAHHAGVLPPWKALIETLFQQGLIRVVFATETLAAGINMPARTTVISSLSKRTDRGHRLLFPSEFLQMAGRAGRRGMDDQGYVIILQTPFEGAREAVRFALADPDPLESKFTPSYGMVLNLLQMHTLEETKELVQRSFGQFLSLRALQPLQEKLAQLQAQRDRLAQELAGVDMAQVAAYEKLRQKHKEARRLLKMLEEQARETRQKQLALAVNFAIVGTVLILQGKHIPQPTPAVLVTRVAGGGQFPYLVCLGRDNRWYVVTTHDVIDLHAELPRISAVDYLTPPVDLLPKPGQHRHGNEQTALIAQQIPEMLPVEMAPEVVAQRQEVERLEAQLAAHPGRLTKSGALVQKQSQLEKLDQQIQQLQQEWQQKSQRHWQDFLSLMDMLTECECLESLTPTSLGQTVAALRGDNELWLGLALRSGAFDELSPPHLAAAVAALVMETPRSDSWTNYPLPAPVDAALAQLRPLRRKLFQLQRRYHIGFPLWLEPDLAPLVERWAAGVLWPELCQHTNLDGGDIVRLIRRTMDVLSQIPHAPHLSVPLQTNARLAWEAMNRFPVDEGLED
ncbi:MAG: DEAD/DEAH box helicase [Gloeomargarita sp. SKYG116]|nr:DEAD/DEAH box helicase [Gloeomargarita sp. SKYG116]MDW8401798.1 DEAD/DEAH box helicase [Gloeomargarita sp. SKYGB_i_bin116]